MKTDIIYFDYAAATPMDETAVAAMQPYLTTQFYNPSAVYQPARQVRHSLEEARAAVANVLGAKDQEIIFTAGGTESNNIAIHSVMSRYPTGNIIVSSIEHESVLEPAKKYHRRLAPVTIKGLIDLTKLEAMIDDETVLVSIQYANNEIGTIQPLKEIAAIIEKKRAERLAHASQPLPLLLHTDACQAANYLDLQVTRLGVDLLTLNGGKIYAAKQSGCLYIRTGVLLGQFIEGGGQERAIRSGTENVPAQIAFATMLQKVQADRKQEAERVAELKDSFFAILSQNVSNISLNGDSKKRLPNNLNVLIPGADGERLLMELDEAGIMVATGSACTASNDDPSHVLVALGLTSAEASASIRLTLGRNTTKEEIQRAGQRMVEVINNHRLV